MAAKAYRMSDAIRAAGVTVVMGGPQSQKCRMKALGPRWWPRHADAVALGEADQTWPQIVLDAERGQLKEFTSQLMRRVRVKPDLQPYPVIPWDTLDLDQFNLVPKFFRPLLERHGTGWGTFRVIPIESGRGCPYGLRILYGNRLFRRLDSFSK